MAVGYSLSSESIYPGIYYAGRLAGEAPGLLPQSEQTMIAGSGSQLSYTRWGDYSAMAVDPNVPPKTSTLVWAALKNARKKKLNRALVGWKIEAGESANEEQPPVPDDASATTRVRTELRCRRPFTVISAGPT